MQEPISMPVDRVVKYLTNNVHILALKFKNPELVEKQHLKAALKTLEIKGCQSTLKILISRQEQIMRFQRQVT